MAGLVRLIHPFPSLLDGLVTLVVALIAGADQSTALRLGLAMVGLQASIGALNDVVDAPADAGRKPRKPIPLGVVSVATARAVVVVSAGTGLLLAVPSGVTTLAIAAAILGIGYGYDLLAKGTPWSWLPFAVGIPVLPVFAWFGAVGRLPEPFALLLPAAFAAGAALAIANARADMERDADAGLESVAIRLGSNRAWRLESALLGVVGIVAISSLWLRGAPTAALAATIAAVVVLGGGLVIGRGSAPAWRQRSWEVLATGVALLAAAWLAGVGDLG